MAQSIQEPPILAYYGAAPHIEWFSDGGVAITVPARRTMLTYAASFTGKCMVDLLMIPLFPLLYGVGIGLFALLGKQTPRAFIRTSRDEVSLTGCGDDTLGRRTTFASWPRAQVLEFRANRADPGLYLRLAGKDSLCLLTDLPPEWSAQIGTALTRSLELLGREERFNL